MDLTEDGFFSLINEDGDVREDLKLTEYCNPNTPEAVRDMLKAAEEANERILVSLWLFYYASALGVDGAGLVRFFAFFLPQKPIPVLICTHFSSLQLYLVLCLHSLAFATIH